VPDIASNALRIHSGKDIQMRECGGSGLHTCMRMSSGPSPRKLKPCKPRQSILPVHARGE
jgi:hypothetical protein